MKYFPNKPYIFLYSEEATFAYNNNYGKKINPDSIVDCKKALRNLVIGRAIYAETGLPNTKVDFQRDYHMTLFSQDRFRVRMGNNVKLLTLKDATKLLHLSKKVLEGDRED